MTRLLIEFTFGDARSHVLKGTKDREKKNNVKDINTIDCTMLEFNLGCLEKINQCVNSVK